MSQSHHNHRCIPHVHKKSPRFSSSMMITPSWVSDTGILDDTCQLFIVVSINSHRPPHQFWRYDWIKQFCKTYNEATQGNGVYYCISLPFKTRNWWFDGFPEFLLSSLFYCFPFIETNWTGPQETHMFYLITKDPMTQYLLRIKKSFCNDNFRIHFLLFFLTPDLTMM
jgi:hypothetical protein